MSNHPHKKLSYKLDKYVSSNLGNQNLNNNINSINNKMNPPTVADRNKSKANDRNNLKEKEEGFSVYLMGANEERIKAMRKKEQIERNKIRSNNNSRSIATRKRWEPSIAGSGQGNREKGSSIEKLYEKESRSKSRHNEIKSAGVDYKVVSKLILGDNKSSSNNNSKQIVSKESLTNLEEMIMNINNMKVNVANNMNKLESPMNHFNSGSSSSNNNNINKRNRNAWGEPKYGIGIVYPEYSSSVEHSNNNNNNEKNKNKSGLKIEISDNDNAQSAQNTLHTGNNIKHSSNSGIHINHIEELENYEDEMDLGNINNIYQLDTLGSHRSKEDFDDIHNISSNQGSNMNIMGQGHSDLINMMKSSSTSLKFLKEHNTNNNNNNGSSNLNTFQFQKPHTRSKENIHISGNLHTVANRGNNHNHNFNFWKESGNSKNVTINNSTEFVNKKEMLMMDNLNSSDLLNLSNNLENIIKDTNNNVANKQSIKGTITLGSSSNINNINSINNNVISTQNVVISPKKKIKSAHPKNRTKSVNKTKLVNNNERPFSSIMNLSRLKSISGVPNAGLNLNSNNNNISDYTKNTGKSLLSENVLNQFYNNNIYSNIPSIQFIYKSPQNKTKPQRPLSHIQKAKSNIVGKNMTTNMPNISNIQNLQHINADRFSSRDQNPFENQMEMTTSTQVNFNTSNKKKKTYSNYPMISNVQQINKYSSGSNNNKEKETISASHSKKKFDILSKIEQLDEKKLSKLARVVEELANHPDEQSFLIESTEKLERMKEINQSKDNMHSLFFNNFKDKLNINYIKADSVNFGNININVNNQDKVIEDSNNNVEESPSFHPKDFDSEENNNNKGFSHNYHAANATNPFKFHIKRSPNGSPISNYSVISIVILSTWGNSDKLGLTEVQLFDSKNKKVEIIECHVFNGGEDGVGKIHNNKFHTTDENDMWVTNINSGSNSCTNTNNNILNNTLTNLQSTTQLLNVKIELYFEAVHEVDRMVIWNYNGRDTSKGVKDIEVFKRQHFAWKGNVNKGSFNIKTDYSTRITLTGTPVLHSNLFLADSLDLNEFSISNISPKRKGEGVMNVLPNTTNKDTKLQLKDLMSSQEDESSYRGVNKITVNRRDKLENPAISIINNLNSARNMLPNSGSTSNLQNNEIGYERNVLRTSIGNSNTSHNFHNILGSNTLLMSNNFTSNSVNCRRIKLVMTSNYGDNSYIGLTGMQFLDDKEELINVERAESIGALPKDINTVFNNCGDPRIFENVFNNENEVVDDYFMWLTPYNPFSPPYIEIVFPEQITLSAIRIWNYNKPGQLERGTRTMELILDENYINQKTIILRKGVAEEHVDYSQTILFPIVPFNFTEEELEPFKVTRPACLSYLQDYETPYLPTGFIFTIKLLSTHGDEHYIGLNGVEFFDQLGNSVFKYNNPRVIAKPSGVYELYGMEEDTRYVNNLINGFNSSQTLRNSWLCPFNNPHIAHDELIHQTNLENTFSNFNFQDFESGNNKGESNNKLQVLNNNKTNTVYFIFDRPVSLSYIHFWNYSKKPERGAKEIHISCDENIIYKGCLKKAEEVNMNSSSNSNFLVSNNNSTIILFTSDPNITKNINENLLTDSNTKNKYKFTENTNNNQTTSYIMHLDTADTSSFNTANNERPFTMEK